MKLDEAIKILIPASKRPQPWLDQDLSDAMKLSIEALKLIQRQRPYLFELGEIPLPGETKD